MRYARNPINLIHELNLQVESEVEGKDAISANGSNNDRESVRIQLHVTDTSCADDELDDGALLFHAIIKTMPGMCNIISHVLLSLS